MTVAAQAAVTMRAAAESEGVAMTAGTQIQIGGEPYHGPYEFTPTGEEQTAQTQNRVMLGNVIIKPIPSNYGLITYNGSYLTVS